MTLIEKKFQLQIAAIDELGVVNSNWVNQSGYTFPNTKAGFEAAVAALKSCDAVRHPQHYKARLVAITIVDMEIPYED